MKSNLNWKKYFLEFLSIFIGVTLAFSLNKCNEDRRDARSESKILMEIRNGLELDIGDLQANVNGHKAGLEACNYFRDLIDNKPLDRSKINQQFFNLLRDFVSVQNKSGYESLKSKGLELVENDSLRLAVISLYDFHYEVIEKLEEQYNELQFYQNYSEALTTAFVGYFKFNENGQLVNIRQQISISADDRQRILYYLWRIELNRKFILSSYLDVIERVKNLVIKIDTEVGFSGSESGN